MTASSSSLSASEAVAMYAVVSLSFSKTLCRTIIYFLKEIKKSLKSGGARAQLV